MDENFQNLFILLAVGIGALLIVLWLVRWWLESRYEFRDKTVLITGGSRGLGLILARQLVHQGARLAICARNAPELERARVELEQRGGEVLALPCDVTDGSQVEQLILAVSERFGQIDVLINNAGIIQAGPLEVTTLDDFQEAIATHFWGPLYTTFAVLPQMRQRQSGRIVNISSIGGKISVPHLLPYSASKFALVGLSEGMRAELAKEGIVVTTVCPGLIRTGSPRNAFFKGQHRQEYTWFSISNSLPIISMSADRAARQILKACRRGAAEVTLSLSAQIIDKIHALFPGLTANVLSWVNRLLPNAGGIGRDRATGKESTSAFSPSLLTTLSDQAAQRNNQIDEPRTNSSSLAEPSIRNSEGEK